MAIEPMLSRKAGRLELELTSTRSVPLQSPDHAMQILCPATDIYHHDCLYPQKTHDQGFVNCTGDDLDGGNCWKASHVVEKDCV
jgi:hypothetical protein